MKPRSLTEAEAARIQAAYLLRRAVPTILALARETGLSATAIRKIGRFECYKNVPRGMLQKAILQLAERATVEVPPLRTRRTADEVYAELQREGVVP